MATLYVAEFPGLAATVQGDSVPVLNAPPTVEQTVAIAAGSAASAAFQASTIFVEISTDAICSIQFGTAPVATAVMCRLSAGERIVRRVTPGQKVAVIVNT